MIDASWTLCLFTLAMQAPASQSTVASVAIGVIVGVIIVVISRGIVDYATYWIHRQRLIRLLIFECAATINRLSEVVEQIEKLDWKSPPADEWDRIRLRQCGFVFAGPMDETRELIRYLNPREAKLINRFFDRWQRLSILERKYCQAFENLLEAVAQVKSGGPQQNYFALVKDEYWEQVNAELKDIKRDSIELCHFSYQLIENLFSESGLGSFALIREDSRDRWKSWDKFRIDAAGWARRYDMIVTQES
jgi:hypothetical protein